METLAPILERLQAEPLWHASLGSRELFHSNMLAWIADRFPAETKVTFAPWLERASASIAQAPSREALHFDLVIQLGGYAPLIIENKMYALPDEEQLRRYTARAIKRFVHPSLVLLSLTNPGWPGASYDVDGHRWRWVSYGDLAKRLLGRLPPEPGGFKEEVLSHYAQLVELVQAVADQVDIHDQGERLLLPTTVHEALREVRMTDFAGKLRAYRAGRLIKQLLTGSSGTNVRTWANFSNGSPVLEAFSELPGGDEVGWQYQANQWRLTLILPSLSGRSDEDRARREARAREMMSWFDFGPFVEIMGPAAATPSRAEIRQEFNHYAPDMVYRYRRLDHPTVTQLVELAIACDARARDFGAAPRSRAPVWGGVTARPVIDRAPKV